jgi:2-oxo-4-hydroxy-4-carboxy--5-ureidoimidazoline (OHCU) decarboxylase
MDRIVGGILVLLLGLSGMAAQDEGQDKQQATPEGQYKALLQQYNDAFEEYTTAFREAKLPEDREKVIQEKYPRPNKWAAKFLDLAEKNPREPFAQEALIWIMTSEGRLRRFLPWHEHTPRYEMIWIMQIRAGLAGDKQEQEVRGKAIDLLLRDHVTSPKMGYVAQNLSRDQKSAKLLRAIIDRNPSQEIKAEACLALVREMQGDLGLARQLKDHPDLARSVEQFYGKDYVEQVQKADLARLESEGEQLYTELTEKYVLEMKPARLVELCQQLKYSIDSEKLLRLLYENDQHDEVRGVACLILAQVLEGRAFSLAATDARGAEKMHKESETLLEEAAGKYAEVQMPLEGKIGKKAEGMLFDMRHLSIGKLAPEIEGVDQDDKQFALSDYKGKVVLLDFWSEF